MVNSVNFNVLHLKTQFGKWFWDKNLPIGESLLHADILFIDLFIDHVYWLMEWLVPLLI